MGQRQLAGAQLAAATHQGCTGAAVVGTAKGPLQQQPPLGRQQPCHRIQLGEFQLLSSVQLRQQSGQAPRQQRFAAARWPHQQQVMPACGGNLQGPASMGLALHGGEIPQGITGLGEPAVGNGLAERWCNQAGIGEPVQGFAQAAGRLEGEPIHQGRLPLIGAGQEQGPGPSLAGGEG